MKLVFAAYAAFVIAIQEAGLTEAVWTEHDTVSYNSNLAGAVENYWEFENYQLIHRGDAVLFLKAPTSPILIELVPESVVSHTGFRLPTKEAINKMSEHMIQNGFTQVGESTTVDRQTLYWTMWQHDASGEHIQLVWRAKNLGEK